MNDCFNLSSVLIDAADGFELVVDEDEDESLEQWRLWGLMVVIDEDIVSEDSLDIDGIMIER